MTVFRMTGDVAATIRQLIADFRAESDSLTGSIDNEHDITVELIETVEELLAGVPAEVDPASYHAGYQAGRADAAAVREAVLNLHFDRAHGYPGDDYEDCARWLRKASAALTALQTVGDPT